MPRLGWDMKVGSVAEWLKRDGDQVEVGEPICMIAGDKATTELEALDTGILRIPPRSPEVGEEVPVGTLLAYLLAPGEELGVEGADSGGGAGSAEAPGPADAARSPETTRDEVAADAAGSANAVEPARSAETTRDDPAADGVRGAGAGARSVHAVDAARAPEVTGTERNGNRRLVASPRARRAAAVLGVDWRTLVGSGRGGRVLERDVQKASSQAAPAQIGLSDPASQGQTAPAPTSQLAAVPAGELAADPPAQLAAAPPAQTAPAETAPAGTASLAQVAPAVTGQAAAAGGDALDEPARPLRGVRRVTAERMALSARTLAPVTLSTEADATTLVQLREQALAERGAPEEVPGYTDFILKLAALALVEHPALNAELTDAGIVQHSRVHVGIAVDTPQGLFVPVVRDAAAASLQTITSESRRLIGAAREGTSRSADLEGATFTITNLGMFEIDAFTPIINLPQCAVLGLGRIVARPVVVDQATEQIAVRKMLSLSLTFDHRLVDGAPAARFLQRIKHFVERPSLWLFR